MSGTLSETESHVMFGDTEYFKQFVREGTDEIVSPDTKILAIRPAPCMGPISATSTGLTN